MKMQLIRLTNLIKGHTGAVSENICGPSSFPLQPILPPLIYQRHSDHEFQIPIRGNVPPRVHHQNWQPHAPISAIIPFFGKASQPVDPTNSLGNNLRKPRRNQDKKQWDPIPVTYTELLPKLLERQLVALSYVLPLKPPFPKSYNPNTYCDYHMRIPGHSTEDCISFKKKVQILIEVGKINFKGPNQLDNLLPNFFRARTEEDMEFATISEGVQGRKIGSISEKTEEDKNASELQMENEKLRRLVQDMTYMLNEQKESIIAIRGGM